MMYKKLLTILSRKNTHVFLLGTACMVSSFAIGIQTAGDLQPITLIEAGNSTHIAGDIDGNGMVNTRDVSAILEIAQGYSAPTPEQLKADPNGDGKLTVDDALRLLAILSAV